MLETEESFKVSGQVYHDSLEDWSLYNRSIEGEEMELDDFGVPTLTTQTMGETAQRGIRRHYRAVMKGS